MPQTLNEWGASAYANAVAHGFYDKSPNLVERIALMHSELSEALEELRNGRAGNEIYFNTTDKPGKPEGFPVELIDCVIRICDTLYGEGVDIDAVLALKHNYNVTRPFMHGGKKL